MKNTLKKLLCVLTASALLLAGCGQNDATEVDGPDEVILDESGGENTAKVDSDYLGLAYYANENVNPVLSQSRINHTLCQLLYEGLFQLTEDFQPENLLCEKWNTTDGRQFDLDLRQGIKFWSGAELTAKDVCYTLQLAKSGQNSVYKKQMEQVASIRQTGAYSLRITLSAVNYDFVSLLDIPIFRKGTENDAFSDGTGPYRPLTEGDKAQLQVFDDWHGETKPEAYPTIELATVTHTDAVMSSFQTGDASITPLDRLGISGQSVKGALDVYKVPTANLHFLVMNQSKAIFQQPLVRQALSELMDRETLCSNSLQDYATPAALPVNPQPEGYAAYCTSDPDSALEKLKKAGITDSDGDGNLEYKNERNRSVDFAFTVLVNQENEYKVALLNRYAEDLAASGIKMTVDAVSYAEYESKLSSRSFDMAYCETIMTTDFNLTPLLAAGGALNYGGATGLESQIAAVRAAPAGEQKTAAQKNLYDGFFNTMPILSIGFEQQQVITRSNLAKGINPMPHNIFYGIENWKKK